MSDPTNPTKPTTADTLNDDNFVDLPKNWTWKPGAAFRIKTPVDADEYTLTIVKPVTFEELRDLVDHIMMPKRQELFRVWFEELQKHKLVETESFRQAVLRTRTKRGQNDSENSESHRG